MKYEESFLTRYLQNSLLKEKNVEFESEYIKNIPNKFYRFRSCKNIDFKAIEEDYIWLSRPSEFNDIKDSAIKYNFCSQKEDILNLYFDWCPFLLKEELKKKFPNTDFSRLDISKDLINEYRENCFNKNNSYNRNKLKRYMMSKGMKKNQYDLVDNLLREKLSDENIEKKAVEVLNQFKNDTKKMKDYYLVTCFTQTYKNNKLWETYANKYTGFCIEYDLSNINENTIKDQLLFFSPIIYGNKNAIKFIDILEITKKKYCKERIDERFINDFNVQLHLQLRIKDKTYNHEKEWRLYPEKTTKTSRKYSFPYISKIYLGTYIKPKNEARLLNIARKKNIEVYKQKYDVLRSSFSYEKI